MQIQKYQPTYALILTSEEFNQEQKIQAFVSEIKKPVPPMDAFLVNHDEFPTINKLKAVAGSEVTFSCIFAVFDDLVKSLSVDPLPGDKLGEIVVEVMKDYPSYKLEDVREFALNFKKGKYGAIYGKLDIMTIFTAIKKYDEYRNEVFEQQVRNRSHNLQARDHIAISTENREQSVKKMHELYDKVRLEEEVKALKKQQDKERETRARQAWNDNFQKAYTDAGFKPEDIDSPAAKKFATEYISKFPLSTEYIKNYK